MNVHQQIRFSVLSVVLVLFCVHLAAAAELDVILSTSLNGQVADFEATTDPSSTAGFDGEDVPVVSLPSNYSIFYSRLCSSASSSCRLSIDSWNRSENPRTLNLEYFTTPAQTGTLQLSWSYSNTAFNATLTDYGSDSTRTTAVGSVNLASQTSSTVQVNSMATRYFSLRIQNVSAITDTTPPASITNLQSPSRGKNWVYWSWNKPGDADFSQSLLYLNGINIINTSTAFYNATGLAASTQYTIRINTKDGTGNVNYQNVTNSQVTLAANVSATVTDTTPPASITNLQSPSRGKNWVYWTWNKPSDDDFSQSLLYLNGINIINTSTAFFNATGLRSYTSYTLRINTKDGTGNVNYHDVTNSQTTLAANVTVATNRTLATNRTILNRTITNRTVTGSPPSSFGEEEYPEGSPQLSTGRIVIYVLSGFIIILMIAVIVVMIRVAKIARRTQTIQGPATT